MLRVLARSCAWPLPAIEPPSPLSYPFCPFAKWNIVEVSAPCCHRPQLIDKSITSQKYNLKEQETVESTTDYGHFFLDQIRRTADKNGRKVSGYFETLPDRDSNPDYYKKTKMPISLTMIEKKLDNGDFPTLTELESYCKRMVSNAKEFYPRGSQLFEDAERVRKALSNFMTKYNPAYARGGYTAVPTPLPVEGVVDDADDDGSHVPQPTSSRRKSQVAAKSPEQDEPDGDDEDEDEDEDEEEDDAEGEEDDDEGSQTSKPATILIRRRGPGRPSKGATPRKANARNATPTRPDCEYEDVPYKGLTFQAAQEKIVEEMLRKKDDGGQEPYFEPFVNLPPRVLKDYYRIVKEPISLKKLQKTVKGVRGRNEATGTSEFKNWAAFEETASLLWKNAFFYNEEGSEIYELAQELEEFFKDELKKAKAAVQEPAQPKIKLKVQQPASDQPATSKKITIHVGGKSDSGESPAPPVSHSAGSYVGDQTPTSNGATRQGGLPAIPAGMDRLRSVSVASPSPSMVNNIKREDAARPSPAGTPGHTGTPSAFPPPAGGQVAALSSATFQPIGVAQPQPQTNGIQHQPKPLWDQARRAPGKGAADALITSLKIQTHPMVNVERRFEMTLLPLEKDAQQSVTVHMPPGQLRVQIVLVVPSFLEKEGRQWKLFVLVNRQIAHQAHPVPGQVLPFGARIFEAQLQAGAVNNIEVSVAAALPKGQKLPSGADFEVEQMTVLAHVAKH
ncbi:Bromodomain-containing protein [Colletotrichum somersetense]|nr:Bromodomain-containing protein [Colletotrichum somersetense]